MKTTPLASFLITLLSAAHLSAANIAWVSFHPADDTPSANAATAGFTNAADVGYTKLLAANGHKVTRFVTKDLIDQDPDYQAALNTNDLVIISRSVGSGNYTDVGEAAAWNSLTPPVMILGAYVARSTQLGLTTGTTMADVGTYPLRLSVPASTHPIFKDVAISNGVMVNIYAQRAVFTNALTGVTTNQLGISINNNTLPAGAISLASVNSPSTPIGGPVIVEYPAGSTLYRGDVIPSRRLMLLTGSRESGITSEGAGIFDLEADGQKIFLNAVGYLTTPLSAPLFVSPLDSGANLAEGDTWTFNPGTLGIPPITYQWYKNNQALATGTDATLVFPNLVASDAGSYYMIAANALGRATTSVATLSFATYGSPSITNRLIAYWPLDAALGTKTPDLVSSYDLNMVNMGSTNVVPGKWGNAFSFSNPANQILTRICNTNEDLPIYYKPNFTVSFWVKGGLQSDHRVYAEASTLQNNTMFDLGTHNGGTDGTVDIFIRDDYGTAVPNHAHSTGTAFDDLWHHVAYVQRTVAPGQARAQLFIDGALDPVSTTFTPVLGLNAKTVAIGGVLRGTAGAWYTGLVDEVAIWDRDLSAQEIAILQVTPITNAPSRLAPLTITAFRGDLPAVVKGDSTTLRWDVSKDVGQVTIDQAIGDVTSITTGGTGTKLVSLDATKSFVLTAIRGAETLRATTTVAVVEGVAPDWALLDNFDRYSPGTRVKDSGYWADAAGDSAAFVDFGGNTALRNLAGNSVAYLPLKSLTILEGQARTLFFRMIALNGSAVGVTNIIGVTDKGQRNYSDEYFNIGPAVYVSPLTNIDFGIETNAWYLGARNGGLNFGANSSNPVDFPANPLATNVVYNVWINFTNNSMADYIPDVFSVWVAKEGTANRTLVFQDYASDRDFTWAEAVLGGMKPDLDKLIVLGNSANDSVIVDDIYLSKSGYNSTVPKAYQTAPIGPLPPLQIGRSGSDVIIQWTTGTLQEATSLSGTWTDVSGATPPSYKVTPVGENKFYRARR